MKAAKDRDRAIERLLQQSFKTPAGPTDASTERDVDGDAPLILVSAFAVIAGVVQGTRVSAESF